MTKRFSYYAGWVAVRRPASPSRPSLDKLRDPGESAHPEGDAIRPLPAGSSPHGRGRRQSHPDRAAPAGRRARRVRRCAGQLMAFYFRRGVTVYLATGSVRGLQVRHHAAPASVLTWHSRDTPTRALLPGTLRREHRLLASSGRGHAPVQGRGSRHPRRAHAWPGGGNRAAAAICHGPRSHPVGRHARRYRAGRRPPVWDDLTGFPAEQAHVHCCRVEPHDPEPAIQHGLRQVGHPTGFDGSPGLVERTPARLLQDVYQPSATGARPRRLGACRPAPEPDALPRLGAWECYSSARFHRYRTWPLVATTLPAGRLWGDDGTGTCGHTIGHRRQLRGGRGFSGSCRFRGGIAACSAALATRRIAALAKDRCAPSRRQAGYWSWRAHTSIHSSSVSLRPAERMSASSVKYSSRGGPGANRMSIRAGAPLSLEKAWIPPCGT